MATTPEGKVKAYLKKKLNTVGAWHYWPVPTGFGVAGVPDCIVCFRGRFFGVEVKAPGRRGQKNRGCSALQVMQLNAIRSAGGDARVVDGPDEINKFIAELKA